MKFLARFEFPSNGAAAGRDKEEEAGSYPILGILWNLRSRGPVAPSASPDRAIAYEGTDIHSRSAKYSDQNSFLQYRKIINFVILAYCDYFSLGPPSCGAQLATVLVGTNYWSFSS